LLTEAYSTAHSILTSNIKQLRNLSNCLVEFETLSRTEIDLAIAGGNKEIRKQRSTEDRARKEEREKLKSVSKESLVTEKNIS
jgi:ATP-dependent Zn protease